MRGKYEKKNVKKIEEKEEIEEIETKGRRK